MFCWGNGGIKKNTEKTHGEGEKWKAFEETDRIEERNRLGLGKRGGKEKRKKRKAERGEKRKREKGRKGKGGKGKKRKGGEKKRKKKEGA